MKNFKNYIFTGLMSVIPITITIWIMQILFNFFSKPGKIILDLFISNEFIQNYIIINKFYIYLKHIMGFCLTIIFLYILGIIVKNVFGKKLYSLFESLLINIPIMNKIYTTTKSIISSISSSNNKSFTKVVIIEYPKNDLWTLAMVTKTTKNKNGDIFYNLFVPTTPNPTSGYMIIIKKENAIETDISVDEGLSIIISAGMIGPKEINIK